MLGVELLNIDGVCEMVWCIICDGNCVFDVIKWLCVLFVKKEVSIELLDFNEVVWEVVVMLFGEFQCYGVVFYLDFVDGLFMVSGDCVQLQQVIFNLVFNVFDVMSDI